MQHESFDPWRLEIDSWQQERRKHIEALTVLGNGYFATRGAHEEADCDRTHYPGTYIAGSYNRLITELASHTLEHESLVNCANWLPLRFKIEDNDWFSINEAEIISYKIILDLKRGILSRFMHFKDSQQRESKLAISRLVHMRFQHIAAISWTLTPLNWSGILKVRSGIDGDISNNGVDRYKPFNSRHLNIIDSKFIGEDTMALITKTIQSHIVQAIAARTKVSGHEIELTEKINSRDQKKIEQEFIIKCKEKSTIQIEKVIAICDSKSFAISEPGEYVVHAVSRAADYNQLAYSHKLAWRWIWDKADLEIDSNERHDQLILRVHIFHLIQIASPNTIDLDVGLPARGLHGEAYRGHIFWDEIFIFPYLNLRFPEITRSFLMYRYRRLDEARFSASSEGYQGAMFPWQSGSDGREESQTLHLNPLSDRWMQDKTFKQRHVNAAIAYNIWQYYEITGDNEFLSYYGAEMILEIGRFFASIATFNAGRKRYDICNVVGPDEYHTESPLQRPEGNHNQFASGLKNNSYTNIMASWVLRTAIRVIKLIGEQRKRRLFELLGIDEEDVHRWNVISRKLYLPIGNNGILHQFEGWECLKEFDLTDISYTDEKTMRLDRILEARGDDINSYKVTKQADVLMLFFLFTEDELKDQLCHLSYSLPDGFISNNIDYYSKRTAHGSSLSRVVFAWVLARSNRKQSWHIFQKALTYDLHDSPTSTTSEGIHLGAMAGTVDIIQRCYTGLNIKNQTLYLHPQLPSELKHLMMKIKLKGHWLKIELTSCEITITSEGGAKNNAQVIFMGESYEISPGKSAYFKLIP